MMLNSWRYEPIEKKLEIYKPIKERVQNINLKTRLSDFLSASNSIFSVKYSQQVELGFFSSDLGCILKFVRLCKKLLFTLYSYYLQSLQRLSTRVGAKVFADSRGKSLQTLEVITPEFRLKVRI